MRMSFLVPSLYPSSSALLTPPFPSSRPSPASPLFFNSVQTSAERLRACHRQLGSAIKFLASHGILHRDIKACNALMCMGEGPDGFTVRLLDFGLSQTGAFLKPMEAQGTPGYIAPEVRERLFRGGQLCICIHARKGKAHRALCPLGSSS